MNEECCGLLPSHERRSLNLSIERTSSSKLRLLPAAAHVERDSDAPCPI